MRQYEYAGGDAAGASPTSFGTTREIRPVHVAMRQNQADLAFYHALGESLHTLRGEKSYTISTLSQRCGVTESTLRGYERGEGEMSVYTLYLIAKALESDPQAILKPAITRYQQETALLNPSGAESAEDRETREAGELVRHFLHVEGVSRGDKFKHLVNELKKDKSP